MGSFDDDFFGGGIDELFNRLAGEGLVEYGAFGSDGKRKVFRKSKRNVLGKIFLNKVADSNNVYLIFDLSDKNDVIATFRVDNERNKGSSIVEVRSDKELLLEFPLEELNIKDFKSNFSNGILEVSFRK